MTKKQDWHLNLNRDYIDVTVFGDTQRTYLVAYGSHVPSGNIIDPERACIGCRCCERHREDPFYCGQCRVGRRP